MTTHRQPAVSLPFGRAASGYGAAVDVQVVVARRVADLCAGCCLVGNAGVLDVGCGTGILTESLAALFPTAAITAIDVAPAMIREARRRLRDLPRITWLEKDVRDLPRTGSVGLVASSSALHWSMPASVALERVMAQLVPGGWLVCGMMVEGTLPELRSTWQQTVPGKPFPVALPAAADVAATARAAGIGELEVIQETETVWHASASAVLRRLHQQGVTGCNLPGPRQLLTRGELQRLSDTYDRQWRAADGRVPATYQVLYLKGKAVGGSAVGTGHGARGTGQGGF
ncbi:MAG: hypothetical protein A3K19_26910 [Lentisphaerae bacterium RIFOXYB12_FULL_65_16]|nr:MAG: hypothetical protein A3K18_23885 [Lentisphaerae bacterium RIFOXYA12_64_32]OGV88030.1 MAG: hypothetical protein A3K19_26910 [Lentisphaerae bacterium RIFOXYB12_FULL_65_16]